MNSEQNGVSTIEAKDDFSWGATLGVLVLLLCFIGACFYVLVSSYMDVS